MSPRAAKADPTVRNREIRDKLDVIAFNATQEWAHSKSDGAPHMGHVLRRIAEAIERGGFNR